jgi:hypothetical protein
MKTGSGSSASSLGAADNPYASRAGSAYLWAALPPGGVTNERLLRRARIFFRAPPKPDGRTPGPGEAVKGMETARTQCRAVSSLR